MSNPCSPLTVFSCNIFGGFLQHKSVLTHFESPLPRRHVWTTMLKFTGGCFIFFVYRNVRRHKQPHDICQNGDNTPVTGLGLLLFCSEPNKNHEHCVLGWNYTNNVSNLIYFNKQPMWLRNNTPDDVGLANILYLVIYFIYIFCPEPQRTFCWATANPQTFFVFLSLQKWSNQWSKKSKTLSYNYLHVFIPVGLLVCLIFQEDDAETTEQISTKLVGRTKKEPIQILEWTRTKGQIQEFFFLTLQDQSPRE